jgi:predicted transcriptional regulator
LTVSELLTGDSVSRVAMWKTVGKLRKEGCLRIVAKRGRAKVYELTSRGWDKLNYFDEDGCRHPLCSCKKR